MGSVRINGREEGFFTANVCRCTQILWEDQPSGAIIGCTFLVMNGLGVRLAEKVYKLSWPVNYPRPVW